MRYAKVGETLVALTAAWLPIGLLRHSVWTRESGDAAWTWVASSHDESETRAVAERVAHALSRADGR